MCLEDRLVNSPEQLLRMFLSRTGTKYYIYSLLTYFTTFMGLKNRAACPSQKFREVPPISAVYRKNRLDHVHVYPYAQVTF